MIILSLIKELIILKYHPEHVELIDNSANHSGHAGIRDSTSEVTHLKIIVSKDDIKGKNTLEKHKNIAALLAEYYKTIHSIEIKLI